MKLVLIFFGLVTLVGPMVLATGCSGPVTPVPVRIASGPPPAWQLDPVRRLHRSRTGVYIVQPGDTMWAIAVVHGLDPERLQTWNHIRNVDRLFVGQGLWVKDPVGADGPGIARLGAARLGADARNAGVLRIKPVQKTVPPVLKRRPSGPPPVMASPQPRPSGRGVVKESLNARFLKSGPPKVWVWPLRGRIISRFGWRGQHRNNGIDIKARAGDPVVAAADGVVAYADDSLPSYGNLILLRHGGSFMTAYAHNAKVLVTRGQKVRAGQRIALAGKSGNAGSPRLHFELRRRIKPLNPLKYLPKKRNAEILFPSVGARVMMARWSGVEALQNEESP